jgi:hypothetical protein
MYAAKAARLQKTAVGLTPLVRFFSATFCGCWSLLRKVLIRNRKTSYTFLRYVQVLLCITSEKIEKGIDKSIKMDNNWFVAI